ncbi:Fatty acyl-CoA reductase 2 [Dichanthelium oligosanthes]|uniref:Fatty acyl-CoA reductase 2 n=1 Tax=Dichanthelium oligosanthes TaxID=888268 RepID=A0A1E5VV99_9POAL|nr:Fatty acyl-CoA reductase 2 [Dichanthelium oligosanthes]
MVVNVMLASMAKHGQQPRGTAAGNHVYHVASSAVNPLLYGDLFQICYQYFTRSPLVNAWRRMPILVQPIRFRDNMEQYASDVETNALLRSGGSRVAASSEWLSRRAHDLRAKTVEHIVHLGRIYEPFTFYGSRADTTNTEALFSEMSAEEKLRFDFDARSIDWMDYFTNVHIPGLRKHLMKGRGSV